MARYQSLWVQPAKTIMLRKVSKTDLQETASYNVTVSSIVEEVEIESKLMSTKSTYVSGFGNRKIKLNVGLNKTEIKVKSEKGDVKTYTLNITREDPKDNNYLKEIKIEDLEIEFEKDV